MWHWNDAQNVGFGWWKIGQKFNGVRRKIFVKVQFQSEKINQNIITLWVSNNLLRFWQPLEPTSVNGLRLLEVNYGIHMYTSLDTGCTDFQPMLRLNNIGSPEVLTPRVKSQSRKFCWSQPLSSAVNWWNKTSKQNSMVVIAWMDRRTHRVNSKFRYNQYIWIPNNWILRH